MRYTGAMKKLMTLAIVASLSAAPVGAEGDGFSLIEEGAKLFLKGLMQEVEPAMKDLRGLAEEMEPGLRKFVDEMGPAFADLFAKVDDISSYHAPEMMPNGDIIMRKKTPDEMMQPEGGEVDL